MAMPETTRRWTREMVLALPEALAPYVKQHGLGYVLTSPADLDLGGNQLAQPDVFVLPQLPPDRLSWRGTPLPILVIEVLSPSSARGDRIVKRRKFRICGEPPIP